MQASISSLDSAFEKAINNVMGESGVVGVLAADSKGLCVSAKGNGKPLSAGFIRALSDSAKELCEDPDDLPTVCLETDSTNIFIKEQDDLTVGVYRIPT